MNSIRKFISQVLVFSLFSFCGAFTQMPQMNEAEMQQLETELAEFQRELDAMSPSEQEAFYKSMEDAVKRIDEMAQTPEGKEMLDKLERGEISDEELDALLDDLVSPDSKVQEELLEEPEEEKPKPKPKVVITDQQQKAINDITELINAANDFIVKTLAITDLPAQFGRWTKKQKITVEQLVNWNDFKTKIEIFNTKLNQLLERNPKTNAYVHIEKLLKDKSLLNNLNAIKTVLEQNNLKIEPISPLDQKLSAQTKKALQESINKFNEAFTVLKVVEEISKLLEGFTPDAKEIKEEEAKARKKADLESTRKRRPGRSITVGQEDDFYRPVVEEDYYDDSPYGGGYAPYQGSGYGGYDGFDDPYSDSGRATRAGTPGGASQPMASLTKDKNKGLKDEDTGASAAPRDEKKSTEKGDPTSQFKEDAEIKKLMDRIDTSLVQAAEMIKEGAALGNIKKLVVGPQAVDEKLANEDLVALDYTLKNVVNPIKKMSKQLRFEFKKPYQQKLKAKFKEYEKDFKIFTDQVDALQAQWPELQNSLPEEKLWAYFGVEVAPVADDGMNQETDQMQQQPEEIEETAQQTPQQEQQLSIKSRVPSPISLFDINTSIKSISKVLDDFARSSKTKGKKKSAH